MNRDDIIGGADKELTRVLMSICVVINCADSICDIKRALIIRISGMPEIEPDIFCGVIMTLLVGVREHIAFFKLDSLLNPSFKQKLAHLFI